MSLRVATAIALAVAAEPRTATAETQITPFTGLGTNTVDSFVGWPTLFHVAAVGATVGIVRSGADQDTASYFREHPTWGHAGLVGNILGYTAPTVGTAVFYLVGRASHRDETVVAAYAVMQATALTLATVTTLKFVTGRAPPEDEYLDGPRGASRSFRFGFYRGGVIDGWPSGHTAIMTAMASTLTAYYPKAAVAIIGFTVAAYTGYSMVSYRGGSVHWLSDVTAGFLIAFPIGMNVGRAFREKFDGEKQTARAWTLVPLVARGTLGLSVAWAL